MKRKYQRKSALQRSIALERIKELFVQAEKQFPEKPELSDRYVEIARNIAMKLKVRIPKNLKRRFCRHCYVYLVPGKNCRVRTKEGKVVYSCFNCKKYMRFVYTEKSRIPTTLVVG